MGRAAQPNTLTDFETGWKGWWDKMPIPTSLPAGTVRRVDVLKMIGTTDTWSPSATQSLLDKLSRALDDLLVEKAIRWSPATGLIDIHSGTVNKAMADLKHSIVTSTIRRCVRAVVRDFASDDVANRINRLVDWDQFHALCAEAKVRTDQIQILDVGEALFGTPEPRRPLNRRLWREVDRLLEQNLSKAGYGTRYSRNRVLLFFPDFSRVKADLMRKSISAEIASIRRSLIEQGRDEDFPTMVPDTDPFHTNSSSSNDIEDLKIARRDCTDAKLAASNPSYTPDPGELVFPAGCGLRAAPLWSAKKRSIGGYVLEPIRKTGAEWDRYFPTSTTEPDALDLPVLARAIGRIQALIAAGKSSLVVVPVYWPSLDRAQGRDRYLAFCGRLPGGLRRSLVFELAGLPEDLLSARAEERIVQLRPYCRAVIARVRLGRRDLNQFKKLSLHAIGVDMGELPDYERGIIPGFDAFMDTVEGLKFHTYAHGLNTKSMLVAVQAAGVDYVAGRVIPDSGEAPLGIRDFSIADLYGAPTADQGGTKYKSAH